MKKINQLHIIENKKSLQDMDLTDKFIFEEDAKLMIESLKTFGSSLELLKNITILQPSKYDITLSTQNYFKNNNVKFIKKELYNPQKEEINKVTNYTVIPIGIDYLVNESNLFEEDSYVFYTDLDVIYLKDLHSLLESVQTTINKDKMICTLLPWKQTAENFNGIFRFDYVFQILKQTKIPDQFTEHFKSNNLNTFVNTWFIYAHKDHIFFKEFKNLTFFILANKDLILKQYQNDYKNDEFDMLKDLENIAEELATSIIYERYKCFIDIADIFKNEVSFQENECHTVNNLYGVTKDSRIYHYNSLEYFLNGFNTDIKSLPNFKKMTRLIIQSIGMEDTMKYLNLTIKDLK